MRTRVSVFEIVFSFFFSRTRFHRISDICSPCIRVVISFSESYAFDFFDLFSIHFFSLENSTQNNKHGFSGRARARKRNETSVIAVIYKFIYFFYFYETVHSDVAILIIMNDHTVFIFFRLFQFSVSQLGVARVQWRILLRRFISTEISGKSFVSFTF